MRVSASTAYGQLPTSPEDQYGPLFKAVQMGQVFTDSKTFVDCIPLQDPALILFDYSHQKNQEGFKLQEFVLDYFQLPHLVHTRRASDRKITIDKHIDRLWDRLSRDPKDQEKGGSLLALPEPYIVPGGRFREIYYWDSYFTLLGLREAGRIEMIGSMIRNFAHLIDSYGHIPCGNRSYYLSRSQPPFFSLMIDLYSEIEGEKVYLDYLPHLQREYDFWMQGEEKLSPTYPEHRRVVRLPNGLILNRYWDDKATPRPESFCEDVELARTAETSYGTDPKFLYRSIRAAAESGWDFSSRWMTDSQIFATLETTNILPVDLNCLLQHLESVLAKAYRLCGKEAERRVYEQKAKKRHEAIQDFFWDGEKHFFMDYNFRQRKFTSIFTLAGMYPLFFKLATCRQARYANAHLRLCFMRSGGALTTLTSSGQQWDMPNGWAPLQWITYQGLRRYQFTHTAEQLRNSWLHLMEKQYAVSGTMLEKYNISNTNLLAWDGEYSTQEGFGWTNSIYLKLKNETYRTTS